MQSIRRGALCVCLLLSAVAGASAQKSNDSSGGYPYRIAIPKTTTECTPKEPGHDSIEALLGLLEDYAKWSQFQAAMKDAFTECGPSVIDAGHPVLVALIHKTDVHY